MPMKVAGLEILRCDAGWRNYHFLKLTTDEGIVGWSESTRALARPGWVPSSNGSPSGSRDRTFSPTSGSMPSSTASPGRPPVGWSARGWGRSRTPFAAAVPNLRIMEIDIDRLPWDEELFTTAPKI